MYAVEIDWAPAYELVISLKAYASRSEHRTLELGREWLRRVKDSLSPELDGKISSGEGLEDLDLVDLLVWRCPGDRGADGFLHWFAALSPGELYEILMPLAPEGRAADVTAFVSAREEMAYVVTAWNEQYFSTVDPAILDGLEASAAGYREALATRNEAEVVEAATNGLIIPAGPWFDTLLLVPQYHFRPWNVRGFYRSVRLIEYPVDALPPEPGEIPLRLRRLTRALSDESRLRILRFLSAGEASFTDLVRHTGLSKSTVHHHLVVLRAAGLVLVRDPDDKRASYALRHDAVEEMTGGLRAYLNGD